MESNRARSVLVLDDDEGVLAEYQEALGPREVFATKDPVEAIAISRRETLDLVLVDLWLDNGDPRPGTAGRKRRVSVWGIDVIRDLRRENSSILIVLITGGLSRAYANAAHDAGANGMMPKFIGPQKIVALVEEGRLEWEPNSGVPMSLARNEYEYLTKVYVDNNCEVARTARDLGISRDTVYRKLRERTPRR